ncbi:DUF1851 domain-containing protein [Pseudomonas sp. R2.Fl]|nr:DUF1851 domain-containing protein [Pseudomonas sp. R2.Fl]
MELIASIRDAWGWTGLKPHSVVGENDFGNLIVKDEDGRYWRLCPEDLQCEVVADGRDQLDALTHDQEFLADWYMATLVAQAKASLGLLRPGYKYCLKVPGVLGGLYEASNMAIIPLGELIAASGHLAKEMAELADGSRVRLSVGP